MSAHFFTRIRKITTVRQFGFECRVAYHSFPLDHEFRPAMSKAATEGDYAWAVSLLEWRSLFRVSGRLKARLRRDQAAGI